MFEQVYCLQLSIVTGKRRAGLQYPFPLKICVMPRSFQSLLTPSTITYNYRIAGNWCGNIFSWFPWIGLQSRENFLWKFIVEMTTCSFTPAKYHEKSEQSQNFYHKNWFFMDFMIFQKDYKFATKFPAIRYTWSIFNNTTESRYKQIQSMNYSNPCVIIKIHLDQGIPLS